MRVPRTRDLVLLSFLYFPINLFWTAVMSQVLPVRVEAMGMASKGTSMAIVGSGGAVMATLVMLLVGPLSDNTTHPNGRRYPWIVYGIGLGALSAVGFALADNLWQLLLAYVLMRGGLNAAVAAYSAIVPDKVPLDYQSRAAAWGEGWDLIASVGGLLLTGLLARDAVNQLLNLRLAPDDEAQLAILGICVFCSALMGLCVLINRGWIRGEQLPPEKALPWRRAIGTALAWRPSECPDFFWLFVSRCVMNLGIYTGFEFLRYYVEEAIDIGKGDVTTEVMIISLIFVLGGLAGAICGGWLGDHYSKRRLLYGAGSISALAALGFCLTKSPLVARAMAFGFGLGYSAIGSIDWAFATNLVPKGKEARYLAIFQVAMTVPQILVTGVGGVIGDWYGWRALFWTIPFYILGGMFLLGRVREPHELAESVAST
jgi:MFS family permease